MVFNLINDNCSLTAVDRTDDAEARNVVCSHFRLPRRKNSFHYCLRRGGAPHLKGRSTNEDIRNRFDNDVERFSNLETGQAATIDALLAMEIITQAAISATPTINRCLDIGCGAGNSTIKLLREYAGDFDCDLCDLSEPMLLKAEERLASETSGLIRKFHGDIRSLPLPEEGYQQDVFTYIDKEDSPRPVTFQLELMKKVGFQKTEILHKNSCFAAFGAIKGEQANGHIGTSKSLCQKDY